MKTLLTFLAITCLNAAFLYPLFMGGVGRPFSWFLVAAMAMVGSLCIYLLVRYRREL